MQLPELSRHCAFINSNSTLYTTLFLNWNDKIIKTMSLLTINALEVSYKIKMLNIDSYTWNDTKQEFLTFRKVVTVLQEFDENLTLPPAIII